MKEYILSVFLEPVEFLSVIQGWASKQSCWQMQSNAFPVGEHPWRKMQAAENCHGCRRRYSRWGRNGRLDCFPLMTVVRQYYSSFTCCDFSSKVESIPLFRLPFFLVDSRRIGIKINNHFRFVAHSLIQIGYIRYSSGTWLNTVNDTRFNIRTTVSKEDDRKLSFFFLFFPIESFHMFIFLQFCTVVLCHCDVGKQSPFIIRK